MTRYIGIDPGKDGAVAVLTAGGTVWTTFPMPDGYILGDELEDINEKGDVRAYIESVGSMPGNSGRSMFTFGEGYGTIKGLLIALKIPFETVSPFVWQRTMHQGISRKSFSKPKERSLRALRQLMPDFNPIQPRCRVAHDGIVDAVLIAEYGRRRSLRETFNDQGTNDG